MTGKPVEYVWVRGARCVRCRCKAVRGTSSIDGRPKYECLKCGCSWTQGKKPGQGYRSWADPAVPAVKNRKGKRRAVRPLCDLPDWVRDAVHAIERVTS